MTASTMRQHVRGHAWDGTPLGDASGWSPTLKSAVELTLDCGFPALLAWGADYVIAAYNDAYRPMLGAKPAALGKPFLHVWAEAAHVVEAQLAAAWGGRAVAFEGAEFQLERSGALEAATFDYTFSPVRDERGRSGGVLLIAMETTARRRDEALRAQAEAELRERERREAARGRFLETLLDHAAVCVAVMQGPELRFALTNAAYRALAPGVELAGRTYSEVFPEAAAAGAGDAIRRVIETGQTVVEEAYHGPIPGRPEARWDRRLIRLPSAPGEPPAALVLTVDATHHWRARQALKASEARFREALDAAPFPAMLHRDDGVVLALSDAWCEITGYRREELPTLREWTARAYPEAPESWREVLGAIHAITAPRDEGQHVVRTASGVARVWAFRSAPAGVDPDGRRLVLSMAADVTEARAAHERLERALAERDMLIREVHHRVNNNLQTVSTLLGMERRRFTAPEVRRSFDRMGRRAVAMGLVHRELMGSREATDVDLAALLTRLCGELDLALDGEARGVRIECVVDAPLVDIDLAMLLGLILNELVANALEHGFPNGRTGLIRVALKGGKDWRLEVADDGVGMRRGSGLGMRIVERLARQLGGRLETYDDGGTRHEVIFPPPGGRKR